MGVSGTDQGARFEPGSGRQIATEYRAEIGVLARIAEKPSFDALLASFAQHQDQLQVTEQRRVLAAALLGGSDVIDATTVLPDNLQDALDAAHLAACCHLLHGSRVARQQLSAKVLAAMATQFEASLAGKPRDFLNRIVGKFHNMDAIRIMQLLRRTGLVTRDSPEVRQLALGAAHGTRDVLALHTIPHVDVLGTPQGLQYHLHAETQPVKDVVIIDSDPRYAELYALLNVDPVNRVRAINMDTIQALRSLSLGPEKKRNLITALRIDHRMIPDVKPFLALLGSCADEACDFILTIGAGDTLGDFAGRTGKVQEMLVALAAADFRPLLFRFHRDGNLEQQWRGLRYGNPRASSYQLLYCRIAGEALKKACL